MLTQSSLDFIKERAEKFGAKRVLLFGSALTGPEEEANDIDLAVEGLDSLQAYGFTMELFEALELGEKPVDVVRMEARAPILPIILDEGIEIYREHENTVLPVLPPSRREDA
ncbi:MAG: nucleotidyltransferase domain-containing protein [Synergistaceae bacterium]|jgi:predicted nucleotidyltransferase|nr:nucleotidyltransferase domain-containing protein [Synergistaceae bacterium]